MALKLGRLRIPWPRTESRDGDPYWDLFINKPAADPANSVPEMIQGAPQGNVFPTKTELHTPEITSSQVKELARYLGTDLVGIARLGANDASPSPEHLAFAVVCAVRADYDPREAPGIGGQVPLQNGLFITFVLSAWIRELGFRAAVAPDPDAARLGAAAGLGTLNRDGRLVTASYASRVHVANVIRTDLLLAADG